MGDIVEIMTSTSQPKFHYRISACAIWFEVKGSQCAGIGLLRNPSHLVDLLVVLGDRNNRRSFVGKPNGQCFPVPTPNLLSIREYRRFWMTWHNNTVNVGREGYAKPFLTHKYVETNLYYLTFFVTGPHPPIYWKFELPPQRPLKRLPERLRGGRPVWVQDFEMAHLPEEAIVGGYEDGCLYIIRSTHDNSLAPGKYNPILGVASISWGGREILKDNYQILCGFNYKWVNTALDRIPSGAVVGGYSELNRECLYIGRAIHDGHLIPGRVQVSNKCCSIAFKGREFGKNRYQILVNPQSDPRCFSEHKMEKYVEPCDIHEDFDDDDYQNVDPDMMYAL